MKCPHCDKIIKSIDLEDVGKIFIKLSPPKFAVDGNSSNIFVLRLIDIFSDFINNLSEDEILDKNLKLSQLSNQKELQIRKKKQQYKGKK